MLGTRNKKSQQQIFVVTDDGAVGPGYQFFRDTLIAITGPVPSQLQPHIEPVNAPILPGRRALELDGATFERHIADEERRQTQKATADRALDRDQVVRELFHGDDGAFVAADVLAFPRSSGQRIDARRIVPTWRARDLDRWRDQIRATAAALTR